jgi:predicted NAD-dependent protein-ADP-ribosyltransferase YbiA (DUF1768 family)
VYFVDLTANTGDYLNQAINGIAQWFLLQDLKNVPLNTGFINVLKDPKFTQKFGAGNVQNIHQQGNQGNDIYFYTFGKPYYEFTNFWANNPFQSEKETWKTAEHYFQALKFEPTSKQWKAIVSQANARGAFTQAKAKDDSSPIRSDWHTPLSNPLGYVHLDSPPALDFNILNGGGYFAYLNKNQNTAHTDFNTKKTTNKNTENLLLGEWKTGKIAAMYHVVKSKFMASVQLKELLVDTGNANLFENADEDDYWGLLNKSSTSYKPGLNMLGIVLMVVRDELRGVGSHHLGHNDKSSLTQLSKLLMVLKQKLTVLMKSLMQLGK